MGFTTLWHDLTGPRVKEISPQTQCSWLEKRPQSSRTARKLPYLNLKSNNDKESRPTTAYEGRKKKRTLSISRPKLVEEQRKEYSVSGIQRTDVPDVPTLPRALSPRSNGPSEDITRPGTAITSNGSVSTMERSQLAGSGLPSPDFHSPLPSPRSPRSWRSQEPVLSQAGGEPEDNELPEKEGGLRKRSNSTASGKPKHKRASWFVSGKKKSEVELPPPLPPPSGPPPPLPVVQSTVAELPKLVPSATSGTSNEDICETPVSPATKQSLDGDSILDAFPSVPPPIPARESSRASEAIKRNSTILQDSAAIPTDAGDSDSRRLSPIQSATMRARPIKAPIQTIDGMLAPELKKDLPKHDSKQLPPLPPEAREAVEAPTSKGAEETKTLSFSEELQQEYDRLVENIGGQPAPDAIRSVVGNTEPSPGGARAVDPSKFSNDEALSKLEFGILN